jgi:hypothetical protein
VKDTVYLYLEKGGRRFEGWGIEGIWECGLKRRGMDGE